jgi:phosphohistidine phosphatase SixA
MGNLKGLFAVVGLALGAFCLTPDSSFAQPPKQVNQPSAVIIIRHADKASEPANDPGLTQAGVKRAQDLVTALGDAGVIGIITTQMRRTRETAEPLATKIGVTPEVVTIPADELGRVSRNLSSHLAALQAALHHYAGGVVLVVGHDNSVPELIAALGGPHFPNICGTVYDNLFVVLPAEGKPHFLHSRYGASTPDSDCK